MIVNCTIGSGEQFGYLESSRFLNFETVISDYSSELISEANSKDLTEDPCRTLVSSYLKDIELLCNYEYIIAVSKSCLELSSTKNIIHSHLTKPDNQAQKKRFDKSIYFIRFYFNFSYNGSDDLMDDNCYLLLISKISIYLSNKIKKSANRMGKLVENRHFKDKKESDLILFLYDQYTEILSEFAEVFDLFIFNVYDKDACDLLKNKLRDSEIILEPFSVF